ncbi:MAG: hypothetical protein AB7P43_08720 [Methylocystis sp.]
MRARASIRVQQSVNEQIKCDVPNCEAKRRGISSFCKAHQNAHQDKGHPVLRMPRGEERRWMLAEGERMLEWLREKHGAVNVESWLRAAARRITASPSMAIPPRKIDRRMTQRTRAEIILAYFLHKRRGDPLTIIQLYLAAELYTRRMDKVFGPTVRNGFTNRVVGQMVARWAKVEEEREVYRVSVETMPSWANQEFRRHEDLVKVKDTYKPQTSVYKMLGKMVREILRKELLLSSVREYYDHLFVKGEA